MEIPFSFLSRAINFFGAIDPTFFFCVAILWNKSARHVRRVSLVRLFLALYSKTFSLNGRQKYKACKTELL